MTHHAATYQELYDAPPRHDEQRHRDAAQRAVLVSALGLGLTGGVELAIAVLTGSVALLGDALHNLADVSTSAVVFLGFFVSKRHPTAAYPYGYERAEDLAGLGVALVIWASALFAGYESYQKLIAATGTTHLPAGIAAAVIGIGGNFVVARYKAHVARQIQSTTMGAEATHSWLDTISSLGALVGLIGVGLGYRWADPVAGFAVTLFIAHVGVEVTREIVRHLMDGVEPEHVEAAQRAAAAVPGVQRVDVRGRWMGRSLALEIEGDLAADTTIEQAERIGCLVEQAVYGAVAEARRVKWIPRESHRHR
ncbi:MAG TPA: cation diffusion facilitator family transporter [Chloroflexota bacterium]|nr:cation diffusion facilitator family transporter [Chloroflexota bacterium]